jgi:cell division transport system permease protein
MKSLKTTWKHIRRSPYQTAAAILTLFITLLLAGFFSITSFASMEMLRYFEGKPMITVFFTDRAGKTEADALTAVLQATGKVQTTRFVSKEEALTLYKEQNKNDPLLLEMVTADILPASLEIVPRDPAYLSELEPLIKQNQAVEEISYQRDVVEGLLRWTRGIRLVLGVLVALLAVNGVLVILTITTMKIALRKEEIDILRLVGASRWYIRSPFIWEGGFYGAVGGLLATGVILGVIAWARIPLLTFLGVIPTIKVLLENPLTPLTLISAFGFGFGLILFGFLLGSIGSFSAVNRYLKS